MASGMRSNPALVGKSGLFILSILLILLILSSCLLLGADDRILNLRSHGDDFPPIQALTMNYFSIIQADSCALKPKIR